jgi:hypothetical protein
MRLLFLLLLAPILAIPAPQQPDLWLKKLQAEEKKNTELLDSIRLSQMRPTGKVKQQSNKREIADLLGHLYKTRQDIKNLSDVKFESQSESWFNVLQQARSLKDLNIESALELESKTK